MRYACLQHPRAALGLVWLVAGGRCVGIAVANVVYCASVYFPATFGLWLLAYVGCQFVCVCMDVLLCMYGCVVGDLGCVVGSHL
jgi:hypothetical protein